MKFMREVLISILHIDRICYGMDSVHNEKPRKYNNPEDLDELCRKFLESNDKADGPAIEYCKDFLVLLTDKPITSGAVVSSRAKSR